MNKEFDFDFVHMKKKFIDLTHKKKKTNAKVTLVHNQKKKKHKDNETWQPCVLTSH